MPLGGGASREHLQDVALPLMTDPYWDADTVFFVFEEDYRSRDVPLMPMTEFLDSLAADATPGDGSKGSAQAAIV